MATHRFTVLGAWGSKQTTLAARRCDKCGFMYVAMNFTAEPAGTMHAIDERGEDLAPERIAGGCPVQDDNARGEP